MITFKLFLFFRNTGLVPKNCGTRYGIYKGSTLCNRLKHMTTVITSSGIAVICGKAADILVRDVKLLYPMM